MTVQGIKENGRNKETLFFPSRFKEYKVTQLGRVGYQLMTEFQDRVAISTNKKIYIPNTIEVISRTALTFTEDAKFYLNRNKKLLLEDLDYYTFDDSRNEEGGGTIVYDVEAHDDITFNRTTLLKANVRYDRNPSAEEEYFFFIDNVERGSKLMPPPAEPTREGYTFAGWYKEAACVHAWDFKTDVTQTVVLEEGQEITYEIQQQENYVTTLYAKWTKK